jgi:hypothetical protein
MYPTDQLISSCLGHLKVMGEAAVAEKMTISIELMVPKV